MNGKNSGAPSKLFVGGEIKTKSQDIAKSQNEHFINKIKTIQDELPTPIGNPLENVKKMMESRVCSVNFRSVHPDDVYKIISDLSNSSSFGMDQIDTYI